MRVWYRQYLKAGQTFQFDKTVKGIAEKEQESTTNGEMVVLVGLLLRASLSISRTGVNEAAYKN